MSRGGGDDDGDDGDDDEFDAAAREIGERLAGAGVPGLEATVEKWLCRLTAAGRGATELDHLRLLRLMAAHGRVGRPFLRPPPTTGRLLPLNVHLRPRPGPGGIRPAASSVSFAWTAAVEPPCAYRRRTVPEHGDARLTGGKCECRLDAADGGTDDDGGGGLCDPCLDRLGLCPRTGIPRPLDAAYRDLLGDCAIPPGLTADESRSVDPGLLAVVRSVDDATTLQDFYLQVSLHACDRGSLLIRTSDGLVENFRSFVRDVLESRTEHIGSRLVDEQVSVRDRYALLRDRALNRAEVALDHVRKTLPAFNWHAYQKEPEAYLRRQILRRAPEPVTRDGDHDDGDHDDGDEDADCNADGDADEDGKSAAARALIALNGLRSEVETADRLSCRLLEERDALTAGLAELGARLSAARAGQADDVRRYRDEMTLLRKESSDQKTAIDRLTEAVQLQLAADLRDRESSC